MRLYKKEIKTMKRNTEWHEYTVTKLNSLEKQNPIKLDQCRAFPGSVDPC